MIEVLAAIHQIALLARRSLSFPWDQRPRASSYWRPTGMTFRGGPFGLPHPALLQALHRIIEEAHQIREAGQHLWRRRGPGRGASAARHGVRCPQYGTCGLARVKAAIRRVDSASLRNSPDEALRCQSRADVERFAGAKGRT